MRVLFGRWSCGHLGGDAIDPVSNSEDLDALVCRKRYMPKLDVVPIEEVRVKTASHIRVDLKLLQLTASSVAEACPSSGQPALSQSATPPAYLRTFSCPCALSMK